MLRPRERVRLDRLRAQLRDLAETLASGRRLSKAQLKRFNAVIARSPVRAELVLMPSGEYMVDFTPVGGDWLDRAERELAGSFSSKLRRGGPSRIKLSADPTCGNVFYDETKNGARIWCDSRTCGNRARVRRFRARTG